MTFEDETNLLHLPNQYIDFEADFAVSCGLPNSEEVLRYLQAYFYKWVEDNDSVHQFAEKYENDGISLWTASDVPMSDDDIQKKRTHFYIVSDKNVKGYALIHCHWLHKDFLQ